MAKYIMDFAKALPSCERKGVIIIVVDRFFKYDHFVGLLQEYFVELKAKQFVSHMVKLYRMLQRIMSDQDLNLLSQFWTTYFKLNGMKLNYSSTHYP
jgi:hypothetical protein